MSNLEKSLICNGFLHVRQSATQDNKWQRGQALPTLDNLVVLAAVFGVTISDIIVCTDTFQIRVIA